MIPEKMSVQDVLINVPLVTKMETVPNVDQMPVQSQLVNVKLTISPTSIKERKFVKFVMSDVKIVPKSSTTVPIVPKKPEDLVHQNVVAQKDG